jgi:hypothetical protein
MTTVLRSLHIYRNMFFTDLTIPGTNSTKTFRPKFIHVRHMIVKIAGHKVVLSGSRHNLIKLLVTYLGV